MLSLAFLLYSETAHAACTLGDVDSAVQAVLLAFATMDEAGVEDAVVDLDTQLGCLKVAVTPAMAAQVHRAHGIASFLAGDSDAAQAAFSAALRIEPSATLPEKIAPEGGKLDRLYSESVTMSPPVTDLGLHADYAGIVDGAESSRRPTDRPAVVQLSSYGTVTYGAWLTATTPVPEQYRLGGSGATAQVTSKPEKVAKVEPEPKPEKVAKAEPEPKPENVAKAEPETKTAKVAKPAPEAEVEKTVEKASKGSRTGIWVGAAVTGVVAGGLFATSVVTESSFDRDPTKLGYTLNHAGYWGSIGTGALALGLFTVAVAGSF